MTVALTIALAALTFLNGLGLGFFAGTTFVLWHFAAGERDEQT